MSKDTSKKESDVAPAEPIVPNEISESDQKKKAAERKKSAAVGWGSTVKPTPQSGGWGSQ